MRPGVCALVVFLVLTPCLGFAAGDVALLHLTKHPRHAKTSHTDSSSVSWKTTPGVLVHVSAPVVLGMVGPVATGDVVVAPSFTSRPPFVPPRA
jgi:hypothetical protein